MSVKAPRLLGCALIALSLLAPFAASAEEKALVVYSARKEEMLRPVLEEFTKATGIPVQILNDETPKLLARIEAEGKDSPVDVLMAVDAMNLALIAEKGLFQPVTSKTVETNIPAAYRSEKGLWFGLSKRVRAIIYNKEKVKPEQLSTYEDLADPKWKGELLTRSSSHAYTQSLIGAMIHVHGAEETQKWANGIAANLAREPQGGDSDQIKAVAAGEASVALANSYYYARMLISKLPEDREAASKAGIFFPNQNPKEGQIQGAHVNISGAGVVATSKNVANAVRLLEYLSGKEGQRFYADSNQEYPVNPSVKASETLQGFGDYKPDSVHLEKLADYSQEAIRIADRAGWR